MNSDGILKWKYKTSASIVQEVIPNIDLQGNIFITNNNGELYSIKPDGTLNWNVIYENGFAGKSPVFSPDGNTIYIAGKDSNLFALNLNGKVKWKFSCGEINRAPMIDSFGNIYFTAAGYFYSLNHESNIRWDYFTNQNDFSIPAIDKQGNLYLIDATCCSIYRRLTSFNFNGDFRWSYIFDDEEVDDFWQPLICDSEGTVYVGSTLGYNYYAISNEGKLKWMLPLNNYQVDNTGTIGEDGTLFLGVHKSSLVTGQKKTLIAIRDTGIVNVTDNVIEIKNNHLQQNYPNPFNPITTISYQIKEQGFVQLKVYNILGKEIAVLVNENKYQGNYSAKFDATNLPSGVYFYSIKLNDFVQKNKMLLLK